MKKEPKTVLSLLFAMSISSLTVSAEAQEMKKTGYYMPTNYAAEPEPKDKFGEQT